MNKRNALTCAGGGGRYLSRLSAGFTNTEAFITGGLSKVLKINNICDNDNLDDCGFASFFYTLDNQKFPKPTKMSELNEYMISVSYNNSGTGYSHTYQQNDTLAAAFETANGESVLAFYYPNCRICQSEVSCKR